MRRLALLLLLCSFAIGFACVVNPQPLPPEAEDNGKGSKDAGRSNTPVATTDDNAEGDDDDDGPFHVSDAGTTKRDSGAPTYDDAGPSDGGLEAGDASDASTTDSGPKDAATDGG